jgi:putative glycosyltransferase
MQLSVVTTLYNSKIFLERFINETIDVITKLGVSEYEIIFVNDGSPDDSLDFLIKIKSNYSCIKLVDLSRNFGHHYAMQVGLMEAQGERVFLIDNDLETPPSILLTFYECLESNAHVDVVYGYQEERKGGFIERVFGGVFWTILNKLSDTNVPHNILTERLMTRRYLDALLSMGDANLFLGGMFHWIGFSQMGIPVKKSLREGKSTYSKRKRIELMVQAITSFSSKPLEWLFFVGVFISMSSLLFIVYLVIQKMIYQDQVSLGWTSIIAVNILILGIISTFLGIIGLYVAKIFKQVQTRPNAVIRKIY